MTPGYLFIVFGYGLIRVNARSLVINTWEFTNATDAAFKILEKGGTAVDGVEAGCNECERDQCDFTVGFGGSPDTRGETTLDALIMDGNTRNVGAVAYLRRIKDAIKVARAVLDHSSHSILAGDGALQFAKMMGFHEESLETAYSANLNRQWRQHQCQPNYYCNVVGKDSKCPPYTPKSSAELTSSSLVDPTIQHDNHDTIGMVVIDSNGRVAAGTSSNGANHKIAGRVGDGAIPGAGSYADSTVGGAAATGDGDIMMRFLPAFQAVQYMREGMQPQEACRKVLHDIARFYPNFKGGLVCANIAGDYGAAGINWQFSYSVRTNSMIKSASVSIE